MKKIITSLNIDEPVSTGSNIANTANTTPMGQNNAENNSHSFEPLGSNNENPQPSWLNPGGVGFGMQYPQYPNPPQIISPYNNDFLWQLADETNGINIQLANHKAHKNLVLLQQDIARQNSINNLRSDLGNIIPTAPPFILIPATNDDYRTLPVFHDILSVAEGFAGHIHMETEVAVLCLLTAIMMAAKGRLIIPCDDFWTEAVVSFALIVRKSGNRKSEYVKLLRTPFDTFIAEYQAAHPVHYFRKENKLIDSAENDVLSRIRHEKLREIKRTSFSECMGNILAEARPVMMEADSFRNKELTEARMFITKATWKKFLRILHAQGGAMASIEAEGGFFLNNFLLNQDRTFILKAHDMEQFDDASIVSGEYVVQYPALTMLHMVQPSVADRIYRNELWKEDGLTPRFNVFFSTEDHHYSPWGVVNENWFQIYSSTITSLLNKYFTLDPKREIFPMTLAPEAYDLVKSFEQKNLGLREHPDFIHMFSFISKAHGKAVRFAAAIHLFRHAYDECPHALPITFEEMQAGIEFTKMLWEHANVAFDRKKFAVHNDAVRITRWLLRSHVVSDIITTRDVEQYCYHSPKHKFSAKEAQDALEHLEKFGLCRVYREANSATLAILNPKFFNIPWPPEFLTTNSY